MNCLAQQHAMHSRRRSGQNPFGQYGSSNIAQAKTVYRRVWATVTAAQCRLFQAFTTIFLKKAQSAMGRFGKFHQQSQTDAYFGMIRNFRRWSWLPLYLFGAVLQYADPLFMARITV